MVLEKAKMRLRREIEPSYIKDLRKIHSKLVEIDNNCLNLSLHEVDSLWRIFSIDYYSDYVNVRKDSIDEFVEWLD